MKDFIDKVGPRYHALLLERDRVEPYSWLESWWNHYAYLDYEAPLPIYSSMVFGMRTLSLPQSVRAAQICYLMILYKEDIEMETIDPAFSRGTPMCMNSTRNFFHTCRNPGQDVDFVTRFTPDESRNIVVLFKGLFFSFDAYDEENNLLPLTTMEKIFECILKGYHRDDYPVGIFTSLNRREWYHNRRQLLENKINQHSLKEVEKSAFIICLDDGHPSTIQELSESLMSGKNDMNYLNRYYDKPFQVCVFENGAAGLIAEHSGSDGLPVQTMITKVLKQEELLDDVYTSLDPNDFRKYVTHLRFFLDDNMLSSLRLSEEKFLRLRENIELNILDFRHYGKSLVKTFNVSPDAWFQISLQMTYYGIHKEFVAAYESGSTSKYRRGRTEVIRSLSVASKDFVLSMFDESCSNEEKRDKFRLASQHHSKYALEATKGFGVDRYLLAMRKLAEEQGEEFHPFINNPLYFKSTTWKLSTSQLPIEYVFIPAVSFVPVVPDGYGIFYHIQDDCFGGTISEWKDTRNGSLFKKHLEYNLLKMRALFQNTSAL
eukprot:TRINITY_DN1596_c0_g2_i1.p1 TRINITY_DN1596_c0_g2~~TRINITY_DN1596_c0_g2_i1.p1  ORF type:complete len:587 (-),score=107.53 TRINITY_DN1596_c0_g2_i1:2916-4550(-)